MYTKLLMLQVKKKKKEGNLAYLIEFYYSSYKNKKAQEAPLSLQNLKKKKIYSNTINNDQKIKNNNNRENKKMIKNLRSVNLKQPP